MIHALFLVAGALGWIAGEGLALRDGITPANGTITTVALLLAGAGVWALRTEPGLGRAGRVGIVLVSFGALSLAMVMIITLTSGVLGVLAAGDMGYGDVVRTPFFILALAFLVGGLGAFALHYRRAPGAAPWLAALFVALALLHTARIVHADLFALHGLANIALAALLAGLGTRLLLRGGRR